MAESHRGRRDGRRRQRKQGQAAERNPEAHRSETSMSLISSASKPTALNSSSSLAEQEQHSVARQQHAAALVVAAQMEIFMRRATHAAVAVLATQMEIFLRASSAQYFSGTPDFLRSPM